MSLGRGRDIAIISLLIAVVCQKRENHDSQKTSVVLAGLVVLPSDLQKKKVKGSVRFFFFTVGSQSCPLWTGVWAVAAVAASPVPRLASPRLASPGRHSTLDSDPSPSPAASDAPHFARPLEKKKIVNKAARRKNKRENAGAGGVISRQ